MEYHLKIFGKELKLLILDVDGVLLDLMACFDKHLPDAATEMGLNIEPVKQYIENLRLGNRRGFSNVYDNIRWLWPELDENEQNKLLELFLKKEKENPYPVIPGSYYTTYIMKERILVALCTTNKLSVTKEKLENESFDMKWFSYLSTWESGYPKPNPRALTIITDSLKIPKENALFVGDWYPDWECAKKAEIPFIAVLSGGIPKHAFLREGVAKDHILNRLFDITHIIEH